jgi:transposase-like protein
MEAYMKRSRRKFDDEFKNDAVYLNSNRSQAEVAEELGISPNALSNWLAKYKKKKEIDKYGEETQEQKIARLEKENATLRRERDILKKSIGIVSNP